jgi:DNA-directed RNA polymerase specialized sigma24 family protein
MPKDLDLSYGGSSLLTPTDDDLLAAWRAGDNAAMRALASRYLQTVRGPLSWLIEDSQDCDEAVADVFASLVAKDDVEFPAFSLGIALTRRAVALGEEWRRAHAAQRQRQAQALRRRASGGRPGPQEVVAALAELPTDFFVPVMLRHLEDRSVAEIGEIIEKGEKQVWSTIHQALSAVDRAIRGAPARASGGGGPTCDPVAILMMLEDELPAREREALASHVERCPECRSHEWRISSLLAFLGTISGMKRKHEQPGATWEKILKKTGRRTSRAKFSRVAQRGVVAVGILGALSLIALVVTYAAMNWPREEDPLAAREAATSAEAEPRAPAPSGAEPDQRAEETVATSLPSTASGAEHWAGGPDEAWIDLPEFEGNASRAGTAELRAAQPYSLGAPRAEAAAPEAPQAPTDPSETGAGEDAAPTRAGWSREEPAEATSPQERTTPEPVGLARNPEPESPMAETTEGTEQPASSSIISPPEIRAPQPPRPQFEGPVLPSIIQGAERVGQSEATGEGSQGQAETSGESPDMAIDPEVGNAISELLNTVLAPPAEAEE